MLRELVLDFGDAGFKGVHENICLSPVVNSVNVIW